MVTILLVEDEEILQQLMVHTLSGEGYEIIEASDGEAGLKLAEEHLPNLIISDMSMPKMTGWDLAKKLRTNPLTAKIPIIALTGHGTSGDRDAAYDAGVNDIIEKPVDMAKLLKKIKRLSNT